MNDKQYARTCFGNPGLFDTIVDIVSPLHLFKSVQQGIYGRGAQDIANKVQPLLAQAPVVGSFFTAVEEQIDPDQSPANEEEGDEA